MSVPGPGWYADPSGDQSRERYWNGQQWAQETRSAASHVDGTTFPPPSGPARPDGGPQQTGAPIPVQPTSTNWIRIAALLFSLGGAAIALFTSVSLLSGMGQVVVGTVLACVGVVIAFAGGTNTGTRATCVILALLAISAAVSDNHQLDQKRREIQNILPTP